MRQIFIKRHRFPPEVVTHAICLSNRIRIRFRDIEDVLAERSAMVSYDGVRLMRTGLQKREAGDLRPPADATRPRQRRGSA